MNHHRCRRLFPNLTKCDDLIIDRILTELVMGSSLQLLQRTEKHKVKGLKSIRRMSWKDHSQDTILTQQPNPSDISQLARQKVRDCTDWEVRNECITSVLTKQLFFDVRRVSLARHRVFIPPYAATPQRILDCETIIDVRESSVAETHAGSDTW
jgi:hypothetical protein